MLQESKLTAFSTTAKPDESKYFYQSVLGLTLLEDTPYALVFDANGTELRVQKISSVSPGSFTTLGWVVANIETTIQALADHGIQCELFPQLQQDQLGIWTAPSGDQIANGDTTS